MPVQEVVNVADVYNSDPVDSFVTLFQFVKANNIQDVYSPELEQLLGQTAASIQQEEAVEEIKRLLRYICKNLCYEKDNNGN